MRTTLCAAALALAALAGCGGGTGPSPDEADFLVVVDRESFVLRVRDPETIRVARESLAGGNHFFPIGPLRAGNGGFNAPWSWHLDPDAVRLTPLAIEVCDALPSYVETHRGDFPTYCPWSARIVEERR
jgi:hypothetical protein